MLIPVEKIRIGERMREISMFHAGEIADSISETGYLINPITVTPDGEDYLLVAGAHRLIAAKTLLGWTEIDANVIEGDATQIQLAEIDENLKSKQLTILEEGEHLIKRQELVGYEQGDNRFTKSRGEIFSPLQTVESLAKEAGLSERSAQQRMQIVRNIIPEVKEIIRHIPDISNSYSKLKTLANLPPAEQLLAAQDVVKNQSSLKTALQNNVIPTLPKTDKEGGWNGLEFETFYQLILGAGEGDKQAQYLLSNCGESACYEFKIPFDLLDAWFNSDCDNRTLSQVIADNYKTLYYGSPIEEINVNQIC